MAEFKSFKNSDRVYLKDVLPVKAPYGLFIETTSVCNARCIYCGYSKGLSGHFIGNMSDEVFEKVKKGLKDFPQRIKLIDMYGQGEPLCNPRLANMIHEIKELDVSDMVGITTNGTLFTKSRADEIIASGIDIIRISIQGLDSETYKKICGLNIDFDEFIENLTYLYEHKGHCIIKIKIADIAIKNIENGLEKFKAIFEPIADSVFVESIIPVYRDVDYDLVDKDIQKNADKGRSNVLQKKVNQVCYRPFIKLRVAANGEVGLGCWDFINDIVIGNILDEDLVDIWNGEKRKEFLKMQLEKRRKNHPVCSNCVGANDVADERDDIDDSADKIMSRL